MPGRLRSPTFADHTEQIFVNLLQWLGACSRKRGIWHGLQAFWRVLRLSLRHRAAFLATTRQRRPGAMPRCSKHLKKLRAEKSQPGQRRTAPEAESYQLQLLRPPFTGGAESMRNKSEHPWRTIASWGSRAGAGMASGWWLTSAPTLKGLREQLSE